MRPGSNSINLIDTHNSFFGIPTHSEGRIISSMTFGEQFLEEIGQKGVQITEANAKDYIQLSLRRSSHATTFSLFVCASIHRIRFFTTENGYMGMGMPEIETGDQVLLVAGLPRPLIGRKVGERYQLIGPAYLHGIMDGEKWPEDESQLVDIVF
ncbi:hypothetical protein BKA65DRAFT_510616, partial [Rhexocercosporidium sp. MPI-PUGE-AT-0058]